MALSLFPYKTKKQNNPSSAVAQQGVRGRHAPLLKGRQSKGYKKKFNQGDKKR